MADRRSKIERVDAVAIGAPLLTSGRAILELVGSDRDLYELEVPCVSDDARAGRLVTVSMVVDGAWLRQLVAAAQAT